jgi:hypothetical protein
VWRVEASEYPGEPVEAELGGPFNTESDAWVAIATFLMNATFEAEVAEALRSAA